LLNTEHSKSIIKLRHTHTQTQTSFVNCQSLIIGQLLRWHHLGHPEITCFFKRRNDHKLKLCQGSRRAWKASNYAPTSVWLYD